MPASCFVASGEVVLRTYVNPLAMARMIRHASGRGTLFPNIPALPARRTRRVRQREARARRTSRACPAVLREPADRAGSSHPQSRCQPDNTPPSRAPDLDADQLARRRRALLALARACRPHCHLAFPTFARIRRSHRRLASSAPVRIRQLRRIETSRPTPPQSPAIGVSLKLLDWHRIETPRSTPFWTFHRPAALAATRTA